MKNISHKNISDKIRPKIESCDTLFLIRLHQAITLIELESFTQICYIAVCKS